MPGTTATWRTSANYWTATLRAHAMRDFRDFPWYYLDGLYQRATAGFMPAEAFDVSLTTNQVAVAKSDDLIHLYDAQSWSEVGTLPWKYQALD